MHDSLAVSCVERVYDLDSQIQHLLGRKRLPAECNGSEFGSGNMQFGTSVLRDFRSESAYHSVRLGFVSLG
jgi:hypothetical protein